MRKDEHLSELAETFIAHRRQLRQVALKILGNVDRADDVVQDAYLKILEAETVFVVKQPLAYLHQVVRNLSIDRYRRGAFELGLFTNADDGAVV